MNEIKIARTAIIIAAEINSIKEQTRRILVDNSIEIGRRLVEAKEIIGHGEWGNWLEASVEYSQSTANNLIRIFEEYGAAQITLLGNNAKSQALGNLSYTQAVMLLGIPSEEREAFIKENDIDAMSTRELKQAVKEKLEAEKKLKEAEEKLKHSEIENKNVLAKVEEAAKANSENMEKAEKYREELAKVKAKNKEKLTNMEVEIENLKIHIESTKKELEVAKTSGNNEAVEKLQGTLEGKELELIESNQRIMELEQQLEEKPIEVNAEIPEEITHELEDLRNKVKLNSNENTAKFKVYFDGLVKDFQSILNVLEDMSDPEENQKYRQAIVGFVDKIKETL
jgi:DNA repair exonuclease SbcCD ATPase subunit